MRVPAWEGDYYERIKQRVRARGFATITAFADSQPTASLLCLADQLGKKDVAGSHLQELLVSEAKNTDTVERCAKSFLVRELNQRLPEGWHIEWNDDTMYRRARVFSSWVVGMGEQYEMAGDRVCDALEVASIPEGWLPAGPDDPILVEIFRKHWREPEQEDAPPEE